MNKSLLTGVAIGVAAAAGVSAVAGYKMLNKGPEYAEVVKVTPLTRTVSVPRRECHDETVTRPAKPRDEHRFLGSIAGAVVGGVLGHQIGGGTGRDIATVAGAAAGGYAHWERALEEWAKTVPAEVDQESVAKTQKKLESAKVKLARESSYVQQQK